MENHTGPECMRWLAILVFRKVLSLTFYFACDCPAVLFLSEITVSK